ncbi:amino acid ABC transporter substrate-binding protein [Rhodococcus sp. D2-41]|uniref:ABC transporter substrate-binding protein n=1 Tax=Speluncibacter jeojiensis TaxID=2710754 RepID=A0A9X4M1U8_9ACTN|nr:ABC transporter substrate-binding protein [Rhodococcus sp. D2-41]MDG3009523.1 amino acid ABC transporter substrate-binding protein [Rhodococcus sp. D2-41]MDG3016453.1 ABC transporter substrate-binding protein [Corynebacteriales bacterium D3-21]
MARSSLNRKTVGLFAVLAVSVATVAACSSSGAQSDSASGPYRVLLAAGLSGPGPLTANAQTEVLAAKAGAEVINKAGGIGGRQIEITVVDDGGDATTAVTKVREAINSGQKPDLFLDTGPSSVPTAVLPILKQNKILSFNVSPTADTSDPKKFPLNFDLTTSPDATSLAVAQYAKGKGYESVGIIHSSTSSGETIGSTLQSALQQTGVRSAGNESYDATALDMTAQLQALKNAGASAVFIDAYGASLGYILQNVQRLGWNVPLIGGISASATGLITKNPPDGVLGTPQVANMVTQVLRSNVYDPNDKAVNTMVDTMASLGAIPGSVELAANYDAFPLLASAAKQAGTTTDAAKLATALESPVVQQNAQTAYLPRYHFDATTHAANVDASTFEFIKPGPLVNGQFGHPATNGS